MRDDIVMANMDIGPALLAVVGPGLLAVIVIVPALVYVAVLTIRRGKAAQVVATLVTLCSVFAIVAGFINYFKGGNDDGKAAHVVLIAVGIAGLLAIACMLYYFQVRLRQKHQRFFDSVAAMDDELSESSTVIQPHESKHLPM